MIWLGFWTVIGLLLCGSLGCKTTQDIKSYKTSRNKAELEPWMREALDFSVEQSLCLINKMGNKSSKMPRSGTPDGRRLRLEEPISPRGTLGWTSGFFAGSLWYLYGYLKEYGPRSKSDEILSMAKIFTSKLAPIQQLTNNHDVGLVMFCSYGTALQFYKEERYREILLQTAQSLLTRFNPKVGAIKSWDWWGDKKADYPVIMDNMMNLELLYWAAKQSDRKIFLTVANSHASTTQKEHIRPDGSSYHMVVFDPVNGRVKSKRNYQGYSHFSVWSRGHAWALYGFTMAYRESQKVEYLKTATKIADFLYSHRHMPQDLVPYWDFEDPNIPRVPRDASAAAIYASALMELSQFVAQPKREQYLKMAEITLKNLAASTYRETQVGANSGFILKHSVGSLEKSLMFEIDVPIVYADYYFLEAMWRKIKLDHLN